MRDHLLQTRILIRSAVFASLVAVGGAVHAQDGTQDGAPNGTEKEVESIAESDGPGVILSLDLKGQFTAEADFDNASGGTIESTSFGADLGIMVPIDERARLMLTFGVGITDYDITPAAGAVGTTAATVGTQFDTVMEYNFNGMYSRAMNAKTSFFVGGGVGFAAEGGGSDGFLWNALGGFSHKVNPQLSVGLGVGVFSRIEDDVRILPLPQISYQIDEHWSIGSTGPGARLNYKWSDQLGMGIQAKFDGKSFRIDDDNTLVPDGAVNISGVPVSYYIDYKGGENSRVSLFAEVGAVLGASMEVLNSSGNTVIDEDIDPSVFVGAGLKIQF